MSTESHQPDKTAIQNSKPADVSPATGSAPWPANYPPPDEIDLVDLGVMLWRRWRLMLTVFLILVALTVLAAIFKSPSYEYNTTLKLGTVTSTQSGAQIPLIPPASAAQALESTYVPQAIYQYGLTNRVDVTSLKVTVNTGGTAGDNATIVLSCKSKASKAEICVAVEKTAAEAFIAGNSQTTIAAQNLLAGLQAEAKVLQLNSEKLNASVALYQQQAKALQAHIAKVRQADIDSAKGSGGPTGALSNLLLSTQVQQSVNQLDGIQQTLTVSLPNQQAALAKQIADNQRAEHLQEEMISQNTNHVLNVGLRSLKPVGLGRSAIVGLGIIIAIILAILAALSASYVEQVRERLRITGSGGK